MSRIEIGHGSGGRLTRDLINRVFLKYFHSPELHSREDASYIDTGRSRSAITTDSYVIRPLFFPGGDIGSLSVCGTVNDLLVSGARPRYLSIGFILEEGFPLGDLERILKSIAATAEQAGVSLVTGDTKVVEKDKCDGVYINTTGIGDVIREMSVTDVVAGDALIVTGTMGDHGTAVALARNDFEIETEVQSDCAPLQDLLLPLLSEKGLKWMRDPTRGGVATVLAELAEGSNLGIQIMEEKVPVREDVRFIADMLGYDPLCLANEGKALLVVSSGQAQAFVEAVKAHPLGQQAAVIGHVTSEFRGVRVRTTIGGERLLDMPDEELLPRIC